MSEVGNSPTKTDFNKTNLSVTKKLEAKETKEIKIKKLVEQDPVQA